MYIEMMSYQQSDTGHNFVPYSEVNKVKTNATARNCTVWTGDNRLSNMTSDKKVSGNDNRSPYSLGGTIKTELRWNT